MKVPTKHEFRRLAALGLMGNQMPSWPSVAAARAAGHAGLVMIRDATPDSSYMTPNVPIERAEEMIDRLVAAGASRDNLYLTWMSPLVGRRINAEVWRGPTGLYLNYSTAQTHVRAALDGSGRHVEGVSALAVLRWACCPNSLDDIEALLDRYPDAALEITAFDREIGTIPGRNTVIWECRDY